jgi:hypothetical protein
MSCAYRTHRYRASVTAGPASVFWVHAQHPISLRPPVVRPKQQAVMATGPSTDDAPIPMSLVQYLWSRWHQAPPEDRESVAWLVANLMRSPRWHWDVTVLPDQSLPDPQHPVGFERDGRTTRRTTIGMPIAMLQTIWKQVVVEDVDYYAPIMHRFISITDPALWQEFWQAFCGLRNRAEQPKQRVLQRELYGYLSPRRLPEILREIRRLLRSNAPDDRYTALTVLTRWLESSDHETRTVAAQMLPGWPHVVAALVRGLSSDREIRAVLDRMVPTILTATRPEDRVAWVATLWDLTTDSTLSNRRRYMSADALKRMMIHDPMVATLVRARLRSHLSPHRIISEPVWDPLLATLIRTVCADEVVTMIAEALATVRATMEIDRDLIARRLDPILAAGWGDGYDHRILQIIDSIPGPHWETVLTDGITASVGKAVCDRIRSWFPHDQAMAMFVDHIRARENFGDWPLAPLPASLIPWVGEAARSHPDRLPANTIRRLWLANPVRAWDVTQTMLDSGHPTAQDTALAAMDAGWGIGYDAAMATILRSIMLDHQDTLVVVIPGIATTVAGLGIAPPSLIAALLTELAMKGNERVQRQLISALHRGWGRGQDDLVMHVVERIAERDPSGWVWAGAHATLLRAWDYLPPHVVVSLVDRLVTRAMNGLANEATIGDRVDMMSMAEAAIAAFAPIWTHLPTPQVIDRIAHHVARLDKHAHALAYGLAPGVQSRPIAAWASVIAAGADRLSAANLHAVLAPFWDLSPHGCLNGIERWVRR